MEHRDSPRLILASGSPRRRELLLRYGVKFDVITANVEEQPLPGESPQAFALRAARDKCRDVAATAGAGLVIGADTVVALDEEILGKPRDAADALTTLQRLAGRWHQVMTGIVVIEISSGREHSACELTQVKFADINRESLEAYVKSGEPMDKAGAYGIQGLGAVLVERIEGCYYNVVGLPIHRLSTLLARENVRLL